MVLKENDSDSFPGADYVGADPITSGECCARSTIAELAAAASAAGLPYTIKGAKIFLDASAGELEAVCLFGDPIISSVVPDPIVMLGAWQVQGFQFGPAEGELWLGNAATWGGSGTRVQQGVNFWSGFSIESLAPTQDGLPLFPAHVYVYVINACGERNAVGFETELFEL